MWRPSGLLPFPRLSRISKRRSHLRASDIRGGTNLERALGAGLAAAGHAVGETYLVLLSDAGATDGAIHNGRLAQWYAAEYAKLPEVRRPHTFVFAVGDDANLPLARMLAANHGVWNWVRPTEPIDFKLNAFFAKMGEEPVRGLALHTEPANGFQFVYPIEYIRFAGSAATWVGRYSRPLRADYAAQMAETYAAAKDDAGFIRFANTEIDALKKAPLGADDRHARFAALRRRLIVTLAAMTIRERSTSTSM